MPLNDSHIIAIENFHTSCKSMTSNIRYSRHTRYKFLYHIVIQFRPDVSEVFIERNRIVLTSKLEDGSKDTVIYVLENIDDVSATIDTDERGLEYYLTIVCHNYNGLSSIGMILQLAEEHSMVYAEFGRSDILFGYKSKGMITDVYASCNSTLMLSSPYNEGKKVLEGIFGRKDVTFLPHDITDDFKNKFDYLTSIAALSPNGYYLLMVGLNLKFEVDPRVGELLGIKLIDFK